MTLYVRQFKFRCVIANLPGWRTTLGLKNGVASGTPANPGDDMNEEIGFDLHKYIR